ncbi:uncharacterized protein BDR25DRAFT_253171 [Lindgomyces ingoldianus]|uniref:Uncharacterized protein n=1 Tax=Lindgomyces ingoldianus TaxID=673940 RepID=A0ACB6R8T6_9PLEO|nr:uncharacterized protein BDR25DRAFT_253171 [Lindgomyces ingoldianus]KAF2475693.1 hypothetical protein BDR25DRAFT_253171 [Lindgomyces ingoldianus]
MASNALDSIIDAIRTVVDAVVSNPSPSTIGVTLLVLLLPFLALFILALSQREQPPTPPPGCRKLGLQGKSNLSDQYSKKYSRGADPSPENPWIVKALFIYPLKSCAGVELGESDVIRTGLKHDRQFTFGQYVTSLPSLDGKVESEWNFITQRTFPRLAKVETEVWIPDPEAPGHSPDAEYVKSEGCLVVRFPFSPDADFSLDGLKAYGRILAARLSGKSEPVIEFRVPFNPPKDRIKKMGYRSEKIKIWKDSPEAMNIGCEVPEDVMAKLKYTLGVTNPLSLFRIDTSKYREVFKCAPKKKDVGFQTIIGMADSYPMHILNLASIHHVSCQLPRGYSPLNALRYRANVYVTGPPSFNEDDWARARIGDCTYHISCRTTRCKLPNVDPETGLADRNEPGATMRKYRVIDKGSQSPCLGMQVTPLTEGVISVGDEIELLERGEHFFLKV